jgi:hypothetical protein
MTALFYVKITKGKNWDEKIEREIEMGSIE